MSIVNRIKLARAIMKFASVVTDKGELIYEGDVLVEGTDVFVEDENGEIVAAADGEYIAEDRRIVVKDGEVELIVEKEPIPQQTENLDEKDEKIAALEAEVKEKSDKIDELNNMIAEKDSYITELESKLNTKEEELSAANAKLRESADDPAKKKIQFSKEQIDKNPALKYFA